MDRAIAPGSMDAAIGAMQAALGAEHVLTEGLEDHGDPFAPPGEWYRPGAVLLPGSVEEVQAVLRIANEHGTPVWTSQPGPQQRLRRRRPARVRHSSR